MRSRLLFLTAVGLLAAPSAASAMFKHVVARGETLTSIAVADGLTITQLAAANGLSANAELVAGSTLLIPPQGAGPQGSGAPASAPETSVSAAPGGSYVVAPGDTLSAIAANSGTTVDQLASANGLNPNGVLLAGTTLTVPGSGSGAGASGSGAGPSAGAAGGGAREPDSDSDDASVAGAGTGSSAAGGGSGAGAQPTQETVSAATVGEIASANGVPPALAEAIAYDESGFNNALVSNTGAVGVMQIEPATWRFINSNLVAPPPLSPASAPDNVRAGVLLLRSLLQQTGGNLTLAVAGYYQGLRSVLREGMLPDTRSYVNTILALEPQFGG
ncbi:MAG: lytic transglycosylase [Solirubrobacteraceae bacterium]